MAGAWEIVAGGSAAVAAMAAAASAIAAWRSTGVSLRISREAFRALSADTEQDASTTTVVRPSGGWWRRLLRWVRSRADQSPQPQLKFTALYYDMWHEEKGVGQVVRLINSSAHSARRVEVEVRRNGEVVARDFVDRIPPMPADSPIAAYWEGCQFVLSDDYQERIETEIDLTVSYENEPRTWRWELFVPLRGGMEQGHTRSPASVRRSRIRVGAAVAQRVPD